MAIKTKFYGGTPFFMGYRVVEKGHPLALTDCKADIYALGVIFYELVNERSKNYISTKTIEF